MSPRYQCVFVLENRVLGVWAHVFVDMLKNLECEHSMALEDSHLQSGQISTATSQRKSLFYTGLAISTAILDMRMNDLLKNFTAFSASSEVLNPTYPIRRFGMNFTSVTDANFSKCSLKSFSVNLA